MTLNTPRISGKKLQRVRLLQLATTGPKFAEQIGISYGSLRQIERKASVNIDVTTLAGISRVIGNTPPNTLKLLAPEDDPLDTNVEPYSERPSLEVPTFDLAVAAGPWVSVPEPGEVHEDGPVKDAGIFRIRGDSMEQIWPDGSLVEFRCLRQAGLIENGDKLEVGKSYYVQRIDDATFKRLEKIEPDELVFRAINRKKYPSPIRVNREDVVRLARAMFILRSPE